MDKKYSFILAILITLLAASLLILISSSISLTNQVIKEQVIISRVIDGDTLELSDQRTLRLLNINAPEKNLESSKLATEYLKNYKNKTIEIEITGSDKYERYLARIYAPDYINLKLVQIGYASKFLVSNSELKTFANAEAHAVKNFLGIWKKSSYSDCFETEIFPKEEIIAITSNCDINLKGFTIKDESRKIYTFDDIIFSKIILHSFEGEDNSTDIFWNSKTDIWNNDRDTLYLFDSEGGIAYYEAYGY